MSESPNVWFTADTHFGHENIIHYCDRPFDNAKDMDATLIANWNAVVKPKDHIWHLGDVAMGPRSKDSQYVGRIVRKLNGVKHLITGNHDHNKRNWFIEVGFDTIHYPYTLLPGKPFYSLIHNPHEWKGVPGAMLLCGHVHTAWRRKGNTLNIGVDQWDYTPVSLATVQEVLDD